MIENNKQIDNQRIIEEDEIDLRELFQTILKHKIFIFIFTSIVTFLTLIYALSLPNSYKSEAILTPQEKQQGNLGGLGALAGLAGVDIGGGGGGELAAKESYELLLNNYEYMKSFIVSNQLWQMGSEENYVFTKNLTFFYDLFNSEESLVFNELTKDEKEKLLFGTFLALKSIVSINENKDGTIAISAEHHDRFFAQKLVSLFLKDASNKLVEENKKYIDKQLNYYEERLASTQDISLKTQLAALMSSLIQQRVFAESSDYYKVRLLIKPEVAYVGAKTKPKRALILVVAFITSIILSIFIIFLKEFIQNSKEPDANNTLQ